MRAAVVSCFRSYTFVVFTCSCIYASAALLITSSGYGEGSKKGGKSPSVVPASNREREREREKLRECMSACMNA